MHKLVAKELVRLEHAENNQRDKLVVISPKGEEARLMTAKHFKKIEAKMARNIGRDKVELLRELLLENRNKTNSDRS